MIFEFVCYTNIMASSQQTAFFQSDIAELTALGKRKGDLNQQQSDCLDQIEAVKVKENELKAKRLRLSDLYSNIERAQLSTQQEMFRVHQKFEVVPDLEHDLMVAITDKSPKYHFAKDWRKSPSCRDLPQCLQGATKGWGSEVRWVRISDVDGKGKQRCLKCAPSDQGLTRSSVYVQSSPLDVEARYARWEDFPKPLYHAYCCGELFMGTHDFEIQKLNWCEMVTHTRGPCHKCHRLKTQATQPQAPQSQAPQPLATQPQAPQPQATQTQASIFMPVSPSY